jgi:hypothetical protein
MNSVESDISVLLRFHLCAVGRCERLSSRPSFCWHVPFSNIREVGTIHSSVCMSKRQRHYLPNKGISSQPASVPSYCYVVPSSPILLTLMMETMCSSETSVLTRATAFFRSRQSCPYEAASLKDLCGSASIGRPRFHSDTEKGEPSASRSGRFTPSA